ncbi:unnamed protein product [Meloidogyne enterolobii]|uniref:Uncharacterized protein n=1 Tax=Meloidogyne enterolobii TaxID=390850 RepID=A0ACB0XU00_MELEN
MWLQAPVQEGQILPLKYPTITKIHPSPLTSCNIHISLRFQRRRRKL